MPDKQNIIHTLDFSVPYVHLHTLLRQTVADSLSNPTYYIMHGYRILQLIMLFKMKYGTKH